MSLAHVAPGDPHTAAHNAERDLINTLQDVTDITFKAALHAELPAEAAASTTVAGVVELATNAETTTGTDAVRAVTPAGLKAVTNALPPAPVAASTTVSGIVELATNAEAITGTDAVRAVTPAALKAVTDALPSGGTVPDASLTVKGIVELATNAETTTGTDAVRAVTPAGLKAVTDAIPLNGGNALVTGSSGANTSYWVKLATYTHGLINRDTVHALHVELSPTGANASTMQLVVGVQTGATLSGATVQSLQVTKATGLFASTDFKLIKTQTSDGTTPNIWELWAHTPNVANAVLSVAEIGRNYVADTSIAFSANGVAWQAAVSAGTSIFAAVNSDLETPYTKNNLGGRERLNAVGSVTGSISINAGLGSVITLTPTGNIIVTDIATGASPINNASTYTLIVKQGATVRTIDLSALAAIWLTPAPVHVANKRTVYTIMSTNDGTNEWYISAVVAQ